MPELLSIFAQNAERALCARRLWNLATEPIAWAFYRLSTVANACAQPRDVEWSRSVTI